MKWQSLRTVNGLVSEPTNCKMINQLLIKLGIYIKKAYLYQKGVSLQQISRQMNIGPNILRNFLSKRKGFQPERFGPGNNAYNGPALDENKGKKAADLYRKGYTINQIAAHFNVANQTLLPYLMKALNPNERAEIREKFLSRKDSNFKKIVDKIIGFKNKNPNLSSSQISKLLGIEVHNVKRIVEMFYDGQQEAA